MSSSHRGSSSLPPSSSLLRRGGGGGGRAPVMSGGDEGGGDGSNRLPPPSRRTSRGSSRSDDLHHPDNNNNNDDEQQLLDATVDDNNDDEDDNAQEVDDGDDEFAEKEDPLLLAIDDLEGRVVAAIDDLKVHPGISTSSTTSVHDELAILWRPILEVAAHTGPSVARTYYRGGPDGLEQSVEDVYQRIVSDLVLPVVLEMAQSDTLPARRVASLEFFRAFWKECHKAGSWMDPAATTGTLLAGPYGVPSATTPAAAAATINTPAARATLQRRHLKRLAREGEILRYWVEASIAATVPGVFTDDSSEGTVASRGIIVAAASLRPSFLHIATRIKDADDRGATRLYNPVVKMIDGVLKKLFLGTTSPPSEALLSACIKFLEILCLCCSRKPQDPSSRKRGPSTTEDFSLDDLPTGHPTITREGLDSISEYAFAVLRGLTTMGGQVKLDSTLLSDVALAASSMNKTSTTTTTQVVALLKPAALAYLELETSVKPQGSGGTENPEEISLDVNLDRTNVEFDFQLSQKSYALTINALSALALNRPVYFREAAVCLARRAVHPPEVRDDTLTSGSTSPLSRPAVLALTAQLKGSCLTLLRNALSVATNTWGILHRALKSFDMDVQADKALAMARQATALKTAGRAARNRANMYYEWDASESADRLSKRQRETDDALAQMRAAKAARGLGHGIQLPTSMADAVELVLLNLQHLPASRPAATAGKDSAGATASAGGDSTSVTLEYLIDAVMTNGATLSASHQEGRWYDRDGSTAWSLDPATKERYSLKRGMLDTLRAVREGVRVNADDDDDVCKRQKMFHEQCQKATGDALSRIVGTAAFSRSKSLANLGNQLAARLAFTLGKVPPSSFSQPLCDMAKDSAKACSELVGDASKALEQFVDDWPLVSAGLALGATPSRPDQGDPTDAEFTIHGCLLFEALLQASVNHEENPGQYNNCLDVWVASVVQAGRLANNKPTDPDRKRAASRSAANLQKAFGKLPHLTKSSLLLIASMCDIEDITRKAAEAARKSSQDSIAVSAAAHAAKLAAEKRATSALLMLRDAAFQRSHVETREHAVACAVAVASGRLPSTPGIVDKALKLTMNVLFAKNDTLANLVVDCATSELEYFADKAVSAFPSIEKANAESSKDEHQAKNPLAPQSDEEKSYLEVMRKPAVLYMALCVRRPNIIESLFRLSSIKHADVLSKAVRANMAKLSRAAAAMYGTGEIAMRVASMSSNEETPLLLAFLECLAPSSSDKSAAEDEIIEACFKIQESKADESGKKDPRFIIPVVSVMKRKNLIERLPEFVAADDKIFLAALTRMGLRQQRQALLFRDEPDEENPTLHGMTLCEQLVFLHRLDFASAGLPQKRYLAVIKLCLEDSEVYSDRVVLSALDHMSGVFLANEVSLPLAFMRTVILTCTKHESLHSWICHVLLPRLVEGKIYDDARQWEGWMRCAHMLEKSDDPNVNSVTAVQTLPPEQLMQYQSKWAGK